MLEVTIVPGLRKAFYALEQPALDFQVLGHRLDDPVHLAAPRQVVFEIAGCDQPRRFRSEERRRTRFFRRVQTRQHDSIANFADPEA